MITGKYLQFMPICSAVSLYTPPVLPVTSQSAGSGLSQSHDGHWPDPQSDVTILGSWKKVF